ncbi:hypothetical protein P1J78_04000 [Psychromarinibacter sp. C21-152]|uniref:Uncharacterized protein n=1 Tax=Psychromarinibacter sediminicola TaxID=3033385 RepID=A0AAE3T8A7_9RHOB|nr:hypothetical protein [Psychromarinibacter sediminicola]MDF0599889.1 hypothetical protein [Psychromarinibacter sediminicola]
MPAARPFRFRLGLAVALAVLNLATAPALAYAPLPGDAHTFGLGPADKAADFPVAPPFLAQGPARAE